MRPRQRDPREHKHDVLLRNHRNDLSHVSRGGDGQRGNRAAVGDAEQHPAIQKRRQIAVGLAQINILSAGVGKH